MTTSLASYDMLTFDCYGTLIDWEAGIWDALQPLIATNAADPGRSEILGVFGEIEGDQQAATPAMLYPDLLARVHARLAARMGWRTDAALDAAFGASVPMWPAFQDSATALRALKRRYRLVILSNVHRAGIAASIGRLGVAFDAVYTAEDVGSYKPDPRNFRYMLDRLGAGHGVAPGRILHVAQSLRHDHVPATAAGLARCWIDRQNLAEGGHWGATARVPEVPSVDFRFTTLAALAEAAAAAGG
ncbi:haloacid dehalogenase type II [Limibaculum sp. FT325]|uniref:haloacid dehalogenase type II n=1 Tax=Thermohalobaculum sediminis TaxID=2939436 RepID=UPI0020BD5B62|nr:haloacid dehalogenase type II [Limibaculum sediminis]MCL5778429.1 haloacid dehalogenase type II [Limibaculum sediminis]